MLQGWLCWQAIWQGVAGRSLPAAVAGETPIGAVRVGRTRWLEVGAALLLLPLHILQDGDASIWGWRPCIFCCRRWWDRWLADGRQRSGGQQGRTSGWEAMRLQLLCGELLPVFTADAVRRCLPQDVAAGGGGPNTTELLQVGRGGAAAAGRNMCWRCLSRRPDTL